jgi:hypothetical protein
MSSPTTTQPLSGPGGEGTPQQLVANFVAAVRSQLDDLSADEVTELTGGLEADLTDALAEEGDTPAQRYGDPAEYARELRAAAGLPPRSPRSKWSGETSAERRRRFFFGPALPDLQPQEAYADTLRRLELQPWWPTVRDFLIVVRPAWWVLRAWLAVQLVMLAGGAGDHLIRGGVGGLLLVLLAVVISVQLGRHSPLPEKWQRGLITSGNVIAVIAFLPVAFGASSSNYDNTSDAFSAPIGLSLDGETVSNVFPYDAQGRPLTGVQLYNQNGHPLEIGEQDRYYSNDAAGTSGDLAPGSGQGTPPRWNVFPLQVRLTDENGNPGAVQPVPVPFTAVPPLIAAPTPTPSVSPTPVTATK